MTPVRTEGRTDRREGGNSSLDLERKFLIGFENFILEKISHGLYVVGTILTYTCKRECKYIQGGEYVLVLQTDFIITY